jgi:DNA-binding transcriptional LysR family regulator
LPTPPSDSFGAYRLGQIHQRHSKPDYIVSFFNYTIEVYDEIAEYENLVCGIWEDEGMDRLGAMAILLKVAKVGSLSAAAEQLDIPITTVSRRITELEAHLQTRLLNRSSRHLSLTDVGRQYVEASKQILDRVEEAERAAMGVYNEPKGALTVTAPIVFGQRCLIPIIGDFLRTYPEIDVRVVLTDSLLDLLESNVDVALRIGDLNDSSLIATRVGSVRRVTCGSPAYFAEYGRPEKPEDLRNHPCVTFDNLASPEAWRFMRTEGEALVQIRSRLTVTTAEAAVEGAVQGLGLTRLLSYQISGFVKDGLLETVLENYELSPWPVSLVYTGRELLPKKVRAFLDFTMARIKTHLIYESALLKPAAR